jgi:hypothetical protein
MACGILDTATVVAVFAGAYLLGSAVTFFVFFLTHHYQLFGEHDDAAE